MKVLKTTTSICPACYKVIDAQIAEEKGKAMIKKKCPEHGSFDDVYWSDVKLWKWVEKFAHDGHGISNPAIKKENPVCPNDCGLCNLHKSNTALANLMITNRCELRCFYCFANIGKAKKVFEPTMKELDFMLKTLRAELPVPAKAIQVTGGEPTMREDLIDIIKLCKKRGFTHVQVNTNGIKFGNDAEFVRKVRQAGVNTIYLSFDGFNAKSKGGASEETMRAIENCRKVGMGIVLVPVVIKGINLNQIAEIVRFAAENNDVIRGVNFQPISFVGLMPVAQRNKLRVTIPDVLHELEKGTKGEIAVRDFYPVPSVASISHLASAMSGKPELELSAHQHCGMATYVFIDGKKLIPITRFVDVEKFFKFAEKAACDLERGGKLTKAKVMLQALFLLRKIINKKKAPKGLNLKNILMGIIKSRQYRALGTFHHKSLFIGSMHFQDAYNYDIERVKRCVIHYVQPDGKIIPFCAFNGLPQKYLMKMQQDFGMPIKEWEKRTGKKIADDLYRPIKGALGCAKISN